PSQRSDALACSFSPCCHCAIARNAKRVGAAAARVTVGYFGAGGHCVPVPAERVRRRPLEQILIITGIPRHSGSHTLLIAILSQPSPWRPLFFGFCPYPLRASYSSSRRFSSKHSMKS